MKQRLFAVTLSLLVSLMPAVAILLYTPPTAIQAGSTTTISLPAPETAHLLQEKIGEALLAEMANAAPGDTFRFVVHLTESADLSAKSLPAARSERRKAVVEWLQQTATVSQAALIQRLETLQAAGSVVTYRPFWIINGVAASGTASAIYELAARSDVARLVLDEQRRYFEPPTKMHKLVLAPQYAAPAAGTLSWGLRRIRAPHVWHGLGVDGSGVTVAIVDTGVDWLHPDLNGNYRGNLGNGNVEHAGNWYHAAYPTMTVPFDHIGHGTHVAGTAVGQNGIGVAPGAQWIAVSIAGAGGLIYDSQVHAAFEWLLAPNGKPTLAPDVVNNSWGGPGWYDAFVGDITALQAAGMIMVFAAGNSGPEAGTVNAPASYPDTLAVGASDDIDAVAWFSSRGPSPLTTELKPLLVAPGTNILSALPDNNYGYVNGTSMATPHVAGSIALLLSADPDLSRQDITGLLLDTTVPVSSTHPNNDSGWGLLDTYLATSQQLQHGTLRGSIQSNGVPLPGVTITVTTPTGAELPFTSDQSGQYVAWLQPGTYTLATAPFGFAPVTQNNLVVTVNETTIRDANLSPLPVGTIQGIVREATTGAAVPAATLWAVGTPITTTTDNSGRYTLSLPNGQYELLVRAPAYRLARATVSPVIGQAINYDFSLVAGPTILLVDSGQWYYQTYASYYKASLSALNYAYDRWTIRNPFSDVPALNNLASYDTVIWSSPLDSPGSIGANNVITDYLGLGGNLLISGQNVGSNDGFGFGTQVWWYRDLAANFLGKTEVTRTINGAAHTHFEGLTISLNGGTSAGNQEQVDVVEVRKNALTNAAFYYDDGTIGGLQASHCQPFHIVYLGFGLEGVNQVADRNAILERSFNTFQAPRQPSGARWLPEAIDDFAVPGNRLVYTITLQNLSETMTDTFQLKLSGNDPPLKWPATLVTPTLTLGPCEQAQTVLTIDVPYNAPRDSIHHMQLAAVSGNTQASVIQLNVQHKTPGYILFVDDERWYDREIAFQAALDAMDLPYDVWEVGWNDHGRGSPPFHLLNAYDFILWHTGYDWFDPVTEAENNALTTYLNRGGRLFLSSQDFLYYHHSTALARGYLGVLDYHESITPTLVYGGRHPAVPGALAGPLPLDYGLYQNFSDGLIPASGSQVFWWHDQGMPAAIATATGWRSIFLGLPFETLPPQVQTNAMSSIVGWLSDLGDSTFTAGSRTVSVGRPLAYTLVLRNAEKGVTNRAAITNTLPAGLELVPGSLTGDAVYNSATRQITWRGTIRHNSSHQIRYQARPRATLSPGARLDNHVSIHYQRPHQQHSLSLTRTATVWVDAPDLTSSTLAAIASAPQAAENVTYTLSLHNNGLASTKDATAVVRLPDAFVPITDTLQTSAGLVTLANQRISWEGNLAPGDTVTVSLVLDSVVVPQILRLPATAVISDGITDTWLQDVQLTLVPYVSYFPLIANK